MVPSLYNLRTAGLLDDGFKVLGVDHGDGDDERTRQDLGDFLREQASSKGSEMGKAEIDAACWSWLSDRISYLRGDFDDDAAYPGIAERLKQLGAGSALFYLATAPRFFAEMVERMGKAGLLKEEEGAFAGW